LHDRSVDRGETTDVSAEHLEVRDALLGAWEAYVKAKGVVVVVGGY